MARGFVTVARSTSAVFVSAPAQEDNDDRYIRLHAAEGLDLGQARWRAIRQHQPADRRADPREGAAGRASSVAALLARDTQWREGHDHAGGAAGARPQGRRIRRVAD